MTYSADAELTASVCGAPRSDAPSPGRERVDACVKYE